MSFYQTNNSSIVRFTVRDPLKQVVAPFQNLQRVAQIQKIGAGTGAHFTGACAGTFDNSFLLTPEQIQNGALIINPTGAASGVNRFSTYTLPSAYSLQEFLGGRGAFNMAANLVDIGAGANPMTGLNDYFILDVYNLATNTGVVKAFNNASEKVIQPAVAGVGLPDASVTPVLIQFSSVNSPYATLNGVQNTVTYTVY
jgi:hypothetical protein